MGMRRDRPTGITGRVQMKRATATNAGGIDRGSRSANATATDRDVAAAEGRLCLDIFGQSQAAAPPIRHAAAPPSLTN